MKFTSILILFLSISFISLSQESVFYGYFQPHEAELVPYIEDEILDKNDRIVPNFKGRELVQLDYIPQHYPDRKWQQHGSYNKSTSTSVIWQTQGIGSSISPPDPSGDVDSLYFIQGTNSNGGGAIKIFDKSTGASVTGTLSMQTLSNTNINGLGDPIILYHQTAKRWFITQFASSGNKLLVYVSQTSDPQGDYYLYDFSCPGFPDYPKWSISESSDALLVSTNEGGAPTVYAMRLSEMLIGSPSPFIGVDIGYPLNGFGFQSITPVDLEGSIAAPEGMKPLFVRHRDDEVHSQGSPDSNNNDWIELWEMNINWSNNSASVSKIQDVPIEEIDSDLCGLSSFSCFGQPNTDVKLDPLRETVMYKAPMRVFEDHQAMVLCLTTDVNGANRGGVRWIELRRPKESLQDWNVYQEGTYAPGTTLNRWMPAINIDKHGNIMMAYSTSSTQSGNYPSLKMTGRRACDPLGIMTSPEITIKSGQSSRTSNTRWGDYHHMSIDEFDGETFYYTGVYMEANNAIRTNVSALKFDPLNLDLSILDVFQTTEGTLCGSSAQFGIVLENRGLTEITEGEISWSIDNGISSSSSFNSGTLADFQEIDTIYIVVNALSNGNNNIEFTLVDVNSNGQDENICNDIKGISSESIGTSDIITSSNIDVSPTCQPNSATISLNASNGVIPYTYILNNNSQSSPVFDNLSAGTYNYTIMDSLGCAGFGSFNLNPPYEITLQTNLDSVISCYGQTTSFEIISSGGQGVLTYSSNALNNQNAPSYDDVPAGDYTIMVTDQNGCHNEIEVLISQPEGIAINAIPSMISCFGNTDGSIEIIASGGNEPLTYSIDATNFQSNSVFSNLPEGTYTAIVRDLEGCESLFETTIIEPSELNGTASASPSTTNNGSITVSANGGTSPYSYSIDGENYYSGSLFTGLNGGLYSIYIQDNNGCIQEISVEVEDFSGVMENNLNQMTFSLFPNPSNGVFKLSIYGCSESKLNAKIFNEFGQFISEFDVICNGGKFEKEYFMSTKFANGNYFIGIYNSSSHYLIPFVKL